VYCWAHSETTASKRRAACSQGAKKANQTRALRRQSALLKDMDSLAAFTSAVVLGTLNGRYRVDVGRTVLYGASVLKSILEVSDLEERMAALEAASLPTERRQGWRA
jgi:hypothetical protein